ncbi:MAG: sigma-E processing peptidase SpoIIGA [Eubacteriales bacterium]
MQYEIYLDTLLLLNYIMNYVVLQLSNRFRKRSATRGSIVLGAFIGSIGTIILFLIINLNGAFKFILMYLLLVPIMSIATWREFEIKELIRSSITIVGMTAFMGGLLNVCYTQLPFLQRYGNQAVVLILIIGFLYQCVLWMLQYRNHTIEDVICDVILYNGTQEIHTKGLLDTGNSLQEPITKRPVCMIARELIQARSINGMTKGYCVIPYRSVGKEHGILEGYEIDCMVTIQHGQRRMHKNVIVAIAPTHITDKNAYQIILHPQLWN